MRDVVISAVRPLLLGYSKVSRLTAWRFFAKYGVVSTVLDQKRTVGSYFTLFSVFRFLPSALSDEFTLMSLERIADEMGEFTVVIIPCTEEYSAFVKRNREWLETRFILRSPENACRMTPLKN